MSQTRFRQLGIAVALTAALGLAGAQPGQAQGAVHSVPQHALPQPGIFERVWEWLAGTRSLSGLWAAEGGGIDPNSARTTGAPPAPVRPTTDAGPGIDPDGHS